VCDDAGAARAGQACRRIAAAYWNKALACGMSLCGTSWYDIALLVEILRRSGDFVRARHACLGALKHTALDGLRHILLFQLERIDAADSSQHSMAEALAWDQLLPVDASIESTHATELGAVQTRSLFGKNSSESTRRIS
jgi:hypothetical protein